MKRSRKKDSGRGWSVVKMCPSCGKPESECRCSADDTKTAVIVRLRMEKRRGKPVTVAAASGIPPVDLQALLKELKTSCGVGGTLKGSDLELQGEHRERLRALLKERGFTVKG